MPQANLKPTAEARPLPPAPFAMEASSLSDRGRVRTVNEDSVSVVIPEDPIMLDRKGALLVVADGMGGHEGGERASRLTVDRVRREYYFDSTGPAQALAGAVQAANREVLREARENPRLAGMGTTCTAVAVVNGVAWLAHVGDSRLYLVRGGAAYRMTEDHSATMELVKQGLITLAQADRHEERNVILRAVGTKERLEVATWKDPFPLLAGDLLVLSTDGLYSSIADDDMARICDGCATSAKACEALLARALESDGSDNITVAALRVITVAANEVTK
jgi:protein phosphatase